MGGRLPASAPNTHQVTAEKAILALMAERAEDATICPSEVARQLAGPQGDWRAQMDTVHSAADALLAAEAISLSWKGTRMQKRRGPYRIARR
ncbi:MAG: DUF3253 domain-containing protein [Erythrobacter sp.]